MQFVGWSEFEKNKKASTGMCVVWNICSLLVQKNGRFGLRGML